MSETAADTADLMRATVKDLVDEELRRRGIDPDAPPAATDTRAPQDPSWEAEARAAYLARPAFEIRLAERFADYVRQRAAAHGQAPAVHIESIVRAFWATDPWRLRLAGTAPAAPGAPAGTSLRA